MTDCELIMVDGPASGDLDLNACPDPRIRVTKVPWSGEAVACNAGNTAAPAPYIAVMDHDDRWPLTKLERQLPHLEASPDVGLCHTRYRVIDAFGGVTGPGFPVPATPITDLLAGRFIGVIHSSTLWTRSVIEKVAGYDLRFDTATDVDVFPKVLGTSKVVLEPSVQVEYRAHSANMSRSYKAQYVELLTILRQHLPALAAQAGMTGMTRKRRSAVEHSLRAAYFGQAWDATVGAVRAHQFSSAIGHGMFAAKMDPVLVARLLAKLGLHRLGNLTHG